MGLFEDLNQGNSSLTDEEAYAGILLVAISADGQITTEEARGLLTTLSRMQLYEGWDDDTIMATLGELIDQFQQEGMQSLVKRCVKALPEELRVTAFANASDLVCADGVIEGNEKKFLEDLYQWLGISKETAQTILKVMIYKNRG